MIVEILFYMWRISHSIFILLLLKVKIDFSSMYPNIVNKSVRRVVLIFLSKGDSQANEGERFTSSNHAF